MGLYCAGLEKCNEALEVGGRAHTLPATPFHTFSDPCS